MRSARLLVHRLIHLRNMRLSKVAWALSISTMMATEITKVTKMI